MARRRRPKPEPLGSGFGRSGAEDLEYAARDAQRRTPRDPTGLLRWEKTGRFRPAAATHRIAGTIRRRSGHAQTKRQASRRAFAKANCSRRRIGIDHFGRELSEVAPGGAARRVQVSVNGLTTSMPHPLKSFSFRVARVKPCARAIAAI